MISIETTRQAASVVVDAVEGSKAESAFRDLPYRLYRGDTSWAPPLRYEEKRRWSTRHQASLRYRWSRRFVARRGNRIVGRIAAIIDEEFARRWGERTGFFGFFECEYDPWVAGALLQAAENALRAQGVENVIGPIHLTTHDETGFQVDGFGSPPMLLSPYNPPYYPELLDSAGYTRVREYHSYLWTPEHRMGPAVRRVVTSALRGAGIGSGITIRPLDPARWDDEIRLFFDLYNDSFERVWGSVPIRWDEFLERATRFRPFLVPELVLFAEQDRRPIGCALTLPDVNVLLRRVGGSLFPFGWLELARGAARIRCARVMILGVRPAFTGRGAAALLAHETAEALRRLGYERAELSLVQGANERMRHVIEAFGCPRLKTFRLYGKRIENEGGDL